MKILYRSDSYFTRKCPGMPMPNTAAANRWPIKKIHRRQADGNTVSSIHHAIEVAVLDLIVVFGVPLETLASVNRYRLSALTVSSPEARWPDLLPHFLSHRIQLAGRTHIERGIGIARDEKGAGFQINAIVRERRQVASSSSSLLASNFLQHGDDAIGHFRLFDLSFLQKRDGRWADIDEFPADGSDDSFILIGQGAESSARIWLSHLSYDSPPSQQHGG